MSLFFFGNNFHKNKETFQFFSPQILEVYRILLVETTLESIMFYYTFSVTNIMFVPCTALLYDSTAATLTLKLPTTLLRISCRIHLISLLMMSFSCLQIVFAKSVFQVPSRFSNRTLEYLRHNFPSDRPIARQTDNPQPSYSHDLNPLDYFLRMCLKDRVCENNPQTREDIIRNEIRRIPQEMLNIVVDNFNVPVAVVLSYSNAVHGTNIVLITEKYSNTLLILEWFLRKEFYKLPVSVEKKSERFPYFCKSY